MTKVREQNNLPSKEKQASYRAEFDFSQVSKVSWLFFGIMSSNEFSVEYGITHFQWLISFLREVSREKPD